MRPNPIFSAFHAELAEDFSAGTFYRDLSEDQKRGVRRYILRSSDPEECRNRAKTALRRLHDHRIDFL